MSLFVWISSAPLLLHLVSEGGWLVLVLCILGLPVICNLC